MIRGLARCVLAALTALLILSGSAQADEPLEPPNPSRAAWEAASAAAIKGPADIKFRDQGKIALPAGYVFVPAKEGAAVMESMGNQTDSRFLGIVFPSGDRSFFVTVDYEPSGYVKDDDAKHWDAKELLKNLKEGTEAGNERREKMGIPAMEVTRWVEVPAYDSSEHQLVWSVEARNKGGAPDDDPTINYNTYVLGRDGYFSLDLITTASTVEADKSAARELLGATAFNSGKRYADFDSSTDKVAAYGLAALVGGLAIKKLGLLAVAGAFLLKFAKIIFIAVAAAGGGFAKYFKRKPAQLPAPPTDQ